MYSYTKTEIMSDIEELELLIQQEQQRSEELEEEIKHERRQKMRRGKSQERYCKINWRS